MTSVPSPAEIEYLWIDDDHELARAAERWREHDEIAVDTEFFRERTFYPALGLVQVATDEEIALVDPLAIDDAEPLLEVMRDPQVLKVLHSCSEDLEVFGHEWDLLPEPMADTQIAAAMAGVGWSMGYSSLVEELVGVELEKAHTRSNWVKRPLSADQKRYAALDVAHLLPAWRELKKELEDLGRMHWLEEDCRKMLDDARHDFSPEEAYLERFGGGRGMDRRRGALLLGLAAWREHEARRRDLPRNFVLRKEAVRQIAARPPKTKKALGKIRGVGSQEIRRDGDHILEIVRRAEELPEEELPELGPRPLDLAPHAQTVKQARARVKEIAEELGVPHVLLATRRTVESLVRRHLEGKAPVLPKALRGWREKVAGRALLESLNE